MKFTKQFLTDDLDLPGGENEVHEQITSQSRWQVHYEIVFCNPLTGLFYRAWYAVGATEQQDEGPWEYEDEIECIEVEERPVTKLEWVEVEG